MPYLDHDRLAAIDAQTFRAARPYPWLNPEGLLTAEGYERLVAYLPEQRDFTPSFGKPRAYGQRSHDRFFLEYGADVPVAQDWHDFISELQGPGYLDFLARLLGTRAFALSFHWHYTPRGAAISPHCDARRKLGSHIFYFNTEQDWDPAWGGQTLILDDRGRFARNSAPRVEDFDAVVESDAVGNRSLLFARGTASWHAMRPLQCPEGHLRKVFIVVITRRGPLDCVRRWFGGKPPGYRAPASISGRPARQVSTGTISTPRLSN